MQTPRLPAEFLTASNDQVINIAYEYLEKVFAGIYGEQEDELLRELPQPLADLWVLQWLDYEVIQGGLATYFMNSHGRQAQLAIDALRRCGVEAQAACLTEATLVVSRHQAAWTTRAHDLDVHGEYAVVHPFLDLEGMDELGPVANRFSELWVDSKPYWGDLLDEYMNRFRRSLIQDIS